MSNTNKIILQISGMHCASCVLNIEKDLLKNPGVVSANVSLPLEMATI